MLVNTSLVANAIIQSRQKSCMAEPVLQFGWRLALLVVELGLEEVLGLDLANQRASNAVIRSM